ncbi:MAG: Ig-like domain-containing protein [Thermoleophilia bacterium]
MGIAARLRLALLLIALVAVPSAGAVTRIGSETADPTGTFSAISIPGGSVLITLADPRPESVAVAPAAGVIVRWRSYEFSGTVPAALAVVRRTTGDSHRLVGLGRSTRVTSQLFTLPERLPIAAGDGIGVTHTDTVFSYFFWTQDDAGASYGIFSGLTVGGPSAAPGTTNTGRAMALNADIEPDADADGWGDETQDTCPGVASQDQTDTDGNGQGNVCDADDDGDGLSDAAEGTAGTNPLVADTDADGLGDALEVTAGTSPLLADTDSDGLTDPVELALGTQPLVADSDGDGTDDGADGCPLVAGTAAGCPPPPAPPAPAPAPAPPAPAPPAPAPAPAPNQPPTVRFAAPVEATTLAPGSSLELVLEAADDVAVSSIEVLDGGTTVCRLTEPPYRCAFSPTGATVGSRTLVAIARDGGGSAGTASVGVVVPRFSATGLSAGAFATQLVGRTQLTISGRLELPTAVAPADGCYGRVPIRVRRGKTTLRWTRVALDRTCRFRAGLVLVGRMARPGQRLAVDVSFAGNRAVAPVRARTQSIVLPGGA